MFIPRLRRFFIFHDGLKRLINYILIKMGFIVIMKENGLRLSRFQSKFPYKPFFSPWHERNFRKLVNEVAAFTTTRHVNLWFLQSLMQQCLHLDGEFWEVGIYKGGAARVMEQTIIDTGSPRPLKLRLFDTFEGFADADPKYDLYENGTLDDADEETVRRLLSSDLCEIIKGRAPESFKGLEESAIAFVHIDIDAYHTTLSSLEFIYERMVPGGIILMETYGLPNGIGVKKATDEFCRRANKVVTVLPTAQGLIICN
jgi:O-methyltransferase